MKLFKKIKRYAALSTGNFEKIFRDKEIPPLPEAVMKLLDALKDPEIHIGNIAHIVSSDPGLSTEVLKLANSPLFGLRSEIKSVQQAISTLGLKRLENIAITYGVKKAVKDPKVGGFDFNLFWSVSLYRAIFSKEISVATEIGDPDEAFTGALLQDIALPVLLKDWFEEYKMVYDTWIKEGKQLSKVEDKRLSWNHAQAGAWMAKKWGFPAILVCCIGLHTESLEKIEKLELLDTSVTPVVISSKVPLKNNGEIELFKQELNTLRIPLEKAKEIGDKSYELLKELASNFNIREIKVPPLSQQLEEICQA